MKTTIVCYVNSDDALLAWTADELPDGLRGFAVERELTRNGIHSRDYLNNYAHPGPAAYQQGLLQPSDQWPFRSFSWTDHSVNQDDEVRYRAIPAFDGEQEPRQELASDWSARRSVGVPAGSTFEAFFNRGYVISQFVSRYLDQHYPALTRDQALKQFKQNLGQHVEDQMRAFLGGQLRSRLLELLDETIAGDGHLYGALFELSDPELLERLTKLQDRAHLVLANGSIQPHKQETTTEARKRDENDDARAKLIAAGVDVGQTDRLVAPKPLAHNKFLVLTDQHDTPQRAWTGSTNWTPTGLCTQLNNGLLVNQPAVAAAYLAQWQALRAAGSDHPSSLSHNNGTPTSVEDGSVTMTVHFTRAPNKVDLDALRAIVNSTQQGLLFLMFMPGGAGVLKDVLELAAAKPDLLVRGVVSELPKGRQDEKTGTSTTLKVTLLGAGPAADPAGVTSEFDVVQPEGNPHPTAWWAEETTHKQFLGDVGHAIIHSKVLVVDPFADNPTVVTGSHNFSTAASDANDENFIVIKGDKTLAEAYAVNVETAWRHYAGRLGNAHHTLTGIDYLRALLADQRPSESFWGLVP
jgi:hypothetical protein